MKRIRMNDVVVVITGQSVGHVGKVLRVIGDKVVVDGANIVKKHVKPNAKREERGGIEEKEMAIHVSNVAILNPKSDKPDKIGFRYVQHDGVLRKMRYFKSNNVIID